MLYKQEELSSAVDKIKTLIESMELDVSIFEIDIRESDNSIRVAAYTDDGGCMVRLFGDKDMSRLEREIRELFKL